MPHQSCFTFRTRGGVCAGQQWICDGDQPIARLCYGIVEQPEQNLRYFDQVLKLNPKYLNAYLVRGSLKARNGDLKGAVEDFTSAIKIDPNCADLYANRGIALAKSGNKSQALKDLEKAIKLNPAKFKYLEDQAKKLKS